ncbi:FadR/GntR family transcriptional regulator [Amphibiibacter pelophylacis]|uniref:FadR/GntR family transcriptional regulator n=1 Tax=Amphibiibacter pelophylacis TaxID=1799477 RepID=A0ACC6NZX9_9BURK
MSLDLPTPPLAIRLAEQVADLLEAEIRCGRLSAGEKLPTERLLAAQMGVSRTVLREAVSRLKSAGLLESRQGSGVYVLQPGFVPLQFDRAGSSSLQAVLQIIELRRGIEAEVAALAAQRRTDADVDDIRAAMAAIVAAVDQGGDGVREDVQFHRRIAQAAANPYMVHTLDYLAQFLHEATRCTRANEARDSRLMQDVIDEHEAIIAAIAAGDAAAARQAAAQHMRNAAGRIGQTGTPGLSPG